MPKRLRSPRLSITVYLAAIAAALLVPFFLFVALLLVELEQREHGALQRRAIAAATAISASVDRHLRDMSTTLNLLSTSPELRDADLRAFHNRTQAALSGSPWFLLAVDADGQQLLNTRVPFGTPLGPTSDPESLAEALRTDRIGVSPVFFGRTSGRWVFNVIRPLEAATEDGVAALIMTENSDELSDTFQTGSMPADWSAAIVDQEGRLIAARGDPAWDAGAPFFLGLRNGAANTIGAFNIRLDGEPGLAAHAALLGWSWRVYVWGPVRSGQTSVLANWRALFIGGLMLSLLSAVVVSLLAIRLRRAVQGLSRMAARLGAGEIVSPERTGIRETDLVAYALTEASFDRAQVEQRTHFILRELVHRTKNMLTVVQSMLRQTARQADSLDAFLPSASDRLNGLARSIDLLTEKEWAGVALSTLVRAQIATFVDETDRLEIRGDDFLLKPDAVQNLGMAFHELGTNALKYGALSVPRGRIEVSWEVTGEADDAQIVIEWKEHNGPPVAPATRRGFGTTVLEQHAAATIGGTAELIAEPDGLRWRAMTQRANLEWDPEASPPRAV